MKSVRILERPLKFCRGCYSVWKWIPGVLTPFKEFAFECPDCECKEYTTLSDMGENVSFALKKLLLLPSFARKKLFMEFCMGCGEHDPSCDCQNDGQGNEIGALGETG